MGIVNCNRYYILHQGIFSYINKKQIYAGERAREQRYGEIKIQYAKKANETSL